MLLATVAICCAFCGTAVAQDTSEKWAREGAPTVKTQIDRGEVVYASGNDLVVKMEDGSVRHFVVPDSQRFMIDGRELSVHELTPGMKLQRTVVTTTVPKVVMTVRTIKGRVWNVSPPNSVILRLEDGTNKQYKIPKDQRFAVDGEEKTAFDLRKGMNITATVITQVPETLASQTRTVTGKMPPPPPTPPMEGALLIEDTAPSLSAQTSTPEPAHAELPKTGSSIPLIGLLGAIMLMIGIGLRLIRVRTR